MLTPSDYIGGIPIVVRLDERDVATSATARPNPAAFVLPRTSLLLSILPDVLALFAPLCTSSLSSCATQVWFSFERSAPVDWTYPVGAIKDYVTELKRNRKAMRAAELGQRSERAEVVGATDVDVLAPLELLLRIRQPVSAKLMEKRVPFFMHFDRLEDFMHNEVRQLHKATYTAMYGTFKLYQNTPASALRPADGVALYRPFHTEPSTASSSASASTIGPVFTSPHLLSDYQHLLKDVLGRRPGAYLIKLGFPFATTAVGSGDESANLLTFHCHRVSAAPPLCSLAASATERERSAVEEETPPVPDPREEAVTLGLLLWRLFRVPCLRWLARQRQRGAAAQTAYEHLLQFFAQRYYTDAPAAAVEQLELQDGLKTVASSGGGAGGPASAGGASPLPAVAWAAWEAAMASRFIADYDDGAAKSAVAKSSEEEEEEEEEAGGADCRGLYLSAEERWGFTGSDVGDGDEASSNSRQPLPFSPSGILFEVQGTHPLLATPAKFLETLMSSSDRAIYVTVRVL